MPCDVLLLSALHGQQEVHGRPAGERDAGETVISGSTRLTTHWTAPPQVCLSVFCALWHLNFGECARVLFLQISVLPVHEEWHAAWYAFGEFKFSMAG